MPGHPALGPFLAQLSAGMAEMSADELRAAVTAYGQQLDPAERAALLEAISQAGAEPERHDPDTTLAADAGAFLADVRSGAYVDGWGWDDDLHDERMFGDESWTLVAEDLFVRAGHAVLAGDFAIAARAYEHLVDALLHDDGEGGLPGDPLPTQMTATDIPEAMARYLRAVYEDAVPADRAERVRTALAAATCLAPDLRLSDVTDALPVPLPECDAFLPRWIDELRGAARERHGLFGPHARDLLTEAIILQSGTDGLAAHARTPGPFQPDRYRDWVDALVAAGRSLDAEDAAREALATLGPAGTVRADIAERLARFAVDRADPRDELSARQEAWRADPSVARLARLADAALEADTFDEIFTKEADHAVAGTGPVANSPAYTALTLLLADRIDAAAELARTASPLGWSHAEHPGHAVVPFLLVAGSKAKARQVHATVLSGLFNAIDDHDWLRFNPDPEPSNPSLSTLLTAVAVATEADAESRERWLTLAGDLAWTRTDAIVRAKHRGAYGRAAELVVAHAEAAAIAHGPAAGGAIVQRAHERFPRHVAFRSEVDRHAARSPMV